jgi:single-strand DNA-binding protein
MAFPDNNVTLGGNLTKDPEQNGGGPIKLSLAHNARRKDKMTGEWVDDPSFIDVVLWERELGAGLAKGDALTVTGKLKQERWEDKEGGKRSKVVVVANTIAKTIKKPKAAEIDW